MSSRAAAVAAARAAIICPACGVDWSTLPEDSREIRRLPDCGHAICLRCYASQRRRASGGGAVACPACGVECLDRPERLQGDVSDIIDAIGRLLALMAAEKASANSAPNIRTPRRVQSQLLEISEACFSLAYMGQRRALLCLRRDCNNQQIEAIDSYTGKHLTSLAPGGLREDRTFTSLCLRLHRQQLLVADRYRDRLHAVDLNSGRCLQSIQVTSQPRCLWADEELALVALRDGAELLVLSWDESGRLFCLGSVRAISGRPLSGLRSAVAVSCYSTGQGQARQRQQQLLLLHDDVISAIDRPQLLRRLRRAAAMPGSGGPADAPACDAPADGEINFKVFGLADCSTMTSACCCGAEEDGVTICGCLLFLAGREDATSSDDVGGGHSSVFSDGPLMHGIRVLQRHSASWNLAASIGCRCRCNRCYRGCADCRHQPRLSVDGMAYDSAARRLFACRRGSRLVQIVQLQEALDDL